MKNIFMLISCFLLSPIFSGAAEASKATPFKGWYEVLSRRDVAIEQKDYLLVDVDTLEVLWHRFSDSPFPPDLESYRKEPSILAAFTDRPLYFFVLERSALIGNEYLSLQGAGGDQLELRKRQDGRFDLAVRDNARISVYLLAPPKAAPEMR